MERPYDSTSQTLHHESSLDIQIKYQKLTRDPTNDMYDGIGFVQSPSSAFPNLSECSSDELSAPSTPIDQQSPYNFSQARDVWTRNSLMPTLLDKPMEGVQHLPIHFAEPSCHCPGSNYGVPEWVGLGAQAYDNHYSQGSSPNPQAISCVPSDPRVSFGQSVTTSSPLSFTTASSNSLADEVGSFRSFTPIHFPAGQDLSAPTENTVQPMATQRVADAKPPSSRSRVHSKIKRRRSTPNRSAPKTWKYYAKTEEGESNITVEVKGPEETGEKSSCSECGDRFLRKEHLKRHLDTKHSDVKIFICPVARLMGPRYCCKRANRKDNLKQHLLTHVKSDNSKPMHRNTVIEIAVLLRCLEVVDRINEEEDLSTEDREYFIRRLKQSLAAKPTKSEPNHHIEHKFMEKLGYDCGLNSEECPQGNIVDVRWNAESGQAKARKIRFGPLCGRGNDFPEPSEEDRSFAPPMGPAILTPFAAEAQPSSIPGSEPRPRL